MVITLSVLICDRATTGKNIPIYNMYRILLIISLFSLYKSNELYHSPYRSACHESSVCAKPTRLVNPASGGNHYTCGDMLDLHNYPAPELYLYDAQRATVLGEYGGIGWVVQGHIWEPDRNWGYIQFNSSKEVTDEYVKYAEKLYDLIPRGFSAAVYTQTTDVEVEVNGLMTYDRKVIKLDEKRVREINRKLCESLNK